MIENPQPGLTFGTLDLASGIDVDGYRFEVVGGDFSFGSPQPVNETIETLLQDGSKVVTSGHDNREVSFVVVVSGSDLDNLAAGESALFLECAKPNTLVYTPADGIGAPTQFDVWTSSLEPFFDDMLEVRRLQRAYKLTLVCGPFGGSVDEITTVGATSGATPTTVTINDGSATTGWTQISHDLDSTPSPADVGSGFYAGAVAGSINGFNDHGGHYYAQGSLIYTPAAPVDMSATTFLQVDWADNFYGTSSGIEAYADGVQLTPIGEVAVPGKPYTRATFLCPDASVAQFRIKGPQKMESATGAGGIPTGNLYVDQLVRTNQAPSPSTLRQKVTTVPVAGSARTQGSLSLSHATSALGYTIVHTYPDLGDGYTPDLRRWLTSSSAVTADASLVSGARHMWNAGTPSVFTVPLRILRPGPYLIAARLRQMSGAAGAVSLSAGGVTGLVTFPASTAWQVSLIGVLEVGDHMSSSGASQVLSCDGGIGAATVEVDEVWMFYMGDDAALTRIQLGTSAPSATGASNRLWIDTPNVNRPYPSLWRGTLVDKSDARNAVTDAEAWGDHEFVPPSVTVFTVTTNALDAQVSLTHRPRFHTHARLLP